MALIGLIAGVWWRGQAPRTDPVRAGFLMWAAVAAIYAAAFSTGRVAHTFYVIAVAPAIAALAGGGLVVLWRTHRRGGRQRPLLPVAAACDGCMGFLPVAPVPRFLPWMIRCSRRSGPQRRAVGHGATARWGNQGPRALAARMALAGLATPSWQLARRQLHGRFLPWTAGTAALALDLQPALMARSGPAAGAAHGP